MYSAITIAKYIINKCTEEKHPISNLQLQKILYYIQKDFLCCESVAFTEDFEAWQFGPVIREVYNLYCGFGATPITMKFNISLSQDYIEIINPIIEEKREKEFWILAEEINNQEKAWAKIYNNGLGNHDIIPKKLIKIKG